MSSDNPATIVTQEVRRWLELDDDLLAVMPLVVAVANRLDGPPVWLMIVAPPSSAKSELIMALSGIDGVQAISSITDNTFASGKKREPGDPQHLSLLQRLQTEARWLLAIKDFGTIQSLRRDKRNAIFGQLREIYDGAYYATFGTGVTVDWNGKVGLVVGATPLVDRLQKWSSELGERFVQFRPTAPDRGRVALLAAVAVADEGPRKEALASAYREGFERANSQLADASLAPEAGLIVAQLAQLIVEARTPVHRFGSNDSNWEVSDPEGPARLTKVLTQLHRAAMICYGGDLEASTRLIVRIGLDSIPGKRRTVLHKLAESQEGVTVEAMAAALKCDNNTATRVVGDLAALKLVEVTKPLNRTIYRPSPRLREMAALIYLDEYESEEALQKLFDLPRDVTSEREREETAV
jgi:hypothetical protein